jgi:hypothetical protein
VIARLKGWWRYRRAVPLVERPDDVVAARVVAAAQSRFVDPRFVDPATRRRRMQQVSDPAWAAELRRSARNPRVEGWRRRAEEQERRESEAAAVFGPASLEAEAARLGF